VRAIVFERTRDDNGALVDAGESFRLEADMVFAAVGQKLGDVLGSMASRDGRIVVDEQRRTSVPGVWAGGDCIHGGKDLTVSAVEDGKRAAASIDAALAAIHAS
jgi:dihydropyrimidine dehydrogenase (NAD+) subunit PreT